MVLPDCSLARKWRVFWSQLASRVEKYAILAGWPYELRCGSQMARTLVAISIQTQEIRYPGRLAARIALWLANCAYVGRNWPSNSRNALFWPPSIHPFPPLPPFASIPSSPSHPLPHPSTSFPFTPHPPLLPSSPLSRPLPHNLGASPLHSPHKDEDKDKDKDEDKG